MKPVGNVLYIWGYELWFSLYKIFASQKSKIIAFSLPPTPLGGGTLNLIFWQVRNSISYSSKLVQTPKIKLDAHECHTHLKKMEPKLNINE